MEFIKCKNGHSYDPAISKECPECAKAYDYTIPLGAPDMGNTDSIGKTVPLQRDTVPVNPQVNHWADAQDYMSANYASEGYAPTMPVNYDRGGLNDQPSRPVTGWLVCIDGPEKGHDYRLHDEYNYIGRSAKMDVAIQGDPTVSRENHAIIAYDSQERLFYFAPVSGASIVRHNGKAVLGNVELKNGDRIQVGKGTFMFVPLCGENFQWEE